MIDVKELRVGAHYYNDAWTGMPIARVSSINSFDKDDIRVGLFYDMPYDEDSDPYECVSLSYLEPVPLTAALLDELGFEPIRKHLGAADEEWGMELDGYPIRVMRGYSNHLNRDWSVHIDNYDFDTLGAADVAYLHQLENIVYLCTGKELIKEEE